MRLQVFQYIFVICKDIFVIFSKWIPHGLCGKCTYKSYLPHMHFVSTLPCEVCVFISETENKHENSNSV